MSDAQCIKIIVEASVLELSAIVTPDVLDLNAIIRHGPICEAFEDILYCSVIEKEIYISELPSLPSTQRRVPPEHGTKSSILYLYSPIVRHKHIVRLSEDP